MAHGDPWPLWRPNWKRCGTYRLPRSTEEAPNRKSAKVSLALCGAAMHDSGFERSCTVQHDRMSDAGSSQ